MSFRFLTLSRTCSNHCPSSSHSSIVAIRGCTTTPNKLTDYTPFMTSVALKRKPSPIRALNPIALQKGMISLAAGFPNPNMFPFQSFTFQVPSKESVTHPQSDHQHRSLHSISLSPAELDTALQYSQTPGIPQLLQWLKEYHQTRHTMHFDRQSEWDMGICVHLYLSISFSLLF